MVTREELALERLDLLTDQSLAERRLRRLRSDVDLEQRADGVKLPKKLPHFQDSHLDSGTLRSLFLSAGGGRPTTTAGCSALASTEVAAQRDIVTLPFPNSGKTYAQWRTRMPQNWDGGPIHVLGFTWTANATSGTVHWGIAGAAYTDGLALSTALGTEVVVDDSIVGGAAYREMHSRRAERLLQLGGDPRPTDANLGVRVLFVVSRDASDGADNLAADALLEEVYLAYSTISYGDLPRADLRTLLPRLS